MEGNRAGDVQFRVICHSAIKQDRITEIVSLPVKTIYIHKTMSRSFGFRCTLSYEGRNNNITKRVLEETRYCLNYGAFSTNFYLGMGEIACTTVVGTIWTFCVGGP